MSTTVGVEGLRWKKFPVLNDGFVCLVDVMGDDSSVVQAARVSYGRDERWVEELKNTPDDIPKTHIGERDDWAKKETLKKDRTLIRYLMRHSHTTPFEMAELKFLVRVPMDCWRQWIRHRTASVNEYSTRYTEAIDSQQKTDGTEWRLQSASNKQGSTGHLVDWPDEGEGKFNTYYGDIDLSDPQVSPGDYLSDRERVFHREAVDLYQERLKLGVAKEQARKDLPLSTYTEAYWKIDLKNLLHFLSLRMDSHAQKEIRDYATVIGEQIVAPLFPIVWEAFNDYDPRRDAMILTKLDKYAIINFLKFPEYTVDDLTHIIPNERERKECISKLKKLGFDV